MQHVDVVYSYWIYNYSKLGGRLSFMQNVYQSSNLS